MENEASDRAASEQGVEIPAELVAAFDEAPEARAMFDRLPPSHQREHTGYVAEARRPESRVERARSTVESLLESQGTE